jgi:hypothetical protein
VSNDTLTKRIPAHVAHSLAKKLGIEYAPVIWPGTSAFHVNDQNDFNDFDYFPRWNATFYELQANTWIEQKPFFVFNAMFDEVNEGQLVSGLHLAYPLTLAGTGMMACLRVDQLPVNELFVGLDNDFNSTNIYLEIGGQLTASYHAAVRPNLGASFAACPLASKAAKRELCRTRECAEKRGLNARQ